MGISIELQNVKTGARKVFRFDHAVNLLRYETAIKVSCWKVPDDSKYTFNGELIERRGDEAHKGAKKSQRNNKGTK